MNLNRAADLLGDVVDAVYAAESQIDDLEKEVEQLRTENEQLKEEIADLKEQVRGTEGA